MADITLANTSAGLSTKTVVTAEGAHTVTGLHTFDRDPNAPFAVASGSAVVTNLDADKLDGQEASAFATISGTETLTNKTLTSPSLTTPTVTGAMTLTGGQIAFPASQSSSADANTLDDYEEGSWTPTIGGSGGQSGQVYSTQVGRYVKIGKLVTVQGNVTLSTLGTITDTVQIQGLPFTAENVTNSYAVGGIQVNNLTTTVVSILGQIAPNTTVIRARARESAATSDGDLAQADLSATTQFIFTLTYRATA